jgi:hypothetical protein
MYKKIEAPQEEENEIDHALLNQIYPEVKYINGLGSNGE